MGHFMNNVCFADNRFARRRYAYRPEDRICVSAAATPDLRPRPTPASGRCVRLVQQLFPRTFSLPADVSLLFFPPDPALVLGARGKASGKSPVEAVGLHRSHRCWIAIMTFLSVSFS